MTANKTYLVTFTYAEGGPAAVHTTVSAKSRMDARAKVVRRHSGKRIRIIAVSEQ